MVGDLTSFGCIGLPVWIKCGRSCDNVSSLAGRQLDASSRLEEFLHVEPRNFRGDEIVGDHIGPGGEIGDEAFPQALGAQILRGDRERLGDETGI